MRKKSYKEQLVYGKNPLQCRNFKCKKPSITVIKPYKRPLKTPSIPYAFTIPTHSGKYSSTPTSPSVPKETTPTPTTTISKLSDVSMSEFHHKIDVILV